MKKIDDKTDKQHGHSFITAIAILEDPFLLKELVEELADRRYDIGYGSESVPYGLQAVETSSVEAYVNLNFYIANETDYANRSITTSFLFTCVKNKQGCYNLSWFNSLS